MQTPVASDTTITAISELAQQAGLQHVHMLGWRDLDDEEAGGSEVHAHNIASIWAQSGVQVTMRTSAAVGQPNSIMRDGYKVSRRAGRYGVFPRSALAEITGKLGPCDGLIEIWNGMPFGSPLWWRGPRTIWLHHVHGPMWGMTLPGPVAKIGVAIEEKIAPPLYRHQPMVTLSPSSKRELVEDLGFDEDTVTVISPGVDPFFTPSDPRSATPLVVAVGRLAPVKDFPKLIRIMAAVRKNVPDVELVIVGEGFERDLILSAIDEHQAQTWVQLAGRVTDEELRSLYRSAWVATSASSREGWGMTLTEAAACGTPTVATNISGHADAVESGRSGLLASTESEFIEAMTQVLTDSELRSLLQRGALERAAELTWEHAAIANFEVLADDARRRRKSSRGRS
ncbi:MAG: glycosyltransferase family 4 protein [Microthrixaceae bacterium]